MKLSNWLSIEILWTNNKASKTKFEKRKTNAVLEENNSNWSIMYNLRTLYTTRLTNAKNGILII